MQRRVFGTVSVPDQHRSGATGWAGDSQASGAEGDGGGRQR